VRANCSCHATQVDGVLPGRSNRQQSPDGPINMRRNMRRCSLYSWGRQIQFWVEIMWPFIMASVNHSPARNQKTTTAMRAVMPPTRMHAQFLLHRLLQCTHNYCITSYAHLQILHPSRLPITIIMKTLSAFHTLYLFSHLEEV